MLVCVRFSPSGAVSRVRGEKHDPVLDLRTSTVVLGSDLNDFRSHAVSKNYATLDPLFGLVCLIGMREEASEIRSADAILGHREELYFGPH